MKKIRLNESDLVKIIERVIKEEDMDMDMNVDMGMENDGDAIDITLDHIAMLLKNGECDCGGQKLVLNLGGSGEEEMDVTDIESDYDEQLMESKRKVRTLKRK